MINIKYSKLILNKKLRGWQLKKIASLLGLIVFVFVLNSCDDAGSDSSSVNITELEGTWSESTFHHYSDGDDSINGNDDDQWHKHSVVVNGNNIVHSVGIAWSATLPTIPNCQFILTASFAIGDAAITTVGAKNIDFTQISSTITPLTAFVVTDWNTKSVYGYTNWLLNVAKDIAGREASSGDGFEDANGAISYGIFQIKDDGMLYFGDDEINPSYDGSTEAKREQALVTYGLSKI
jgi:hypothetical protein